MASELEITQEKVLETRYRYVLKIVLLLVGQMLHGLLKCYWSNKANFAVVILTVCPPELVKL